MTAEAPRKPDVLLVDDDEAYHVMVPDVLDDYNVTVAPTLDEARRQIGRAASGEVRWSAVLLDFHLDNGDATKSKETGRLVLDAVRDDLGQDVPVIGFSGRQMDVHGINGLDADPTKDGVFDLPRILDDIVHRQPDQP